MVVVNEKNLQVYFVNIKIKVVASCYLLKRNVFDNRFEKGKKMILCLQHISLPIQRMSFLIERISTFYNNVILLTKLDTSSGAILVASSLGFDEDIATS